MSATRRILVAGLPAAAALALAASPALATVDHPARPAATATPCAQTQRDNCDYGGTATGAGTTTPSGGHTRGHGGYATTPTTPATTPATTSPTSPAPSTTTPSAHVATVPTTSTATTPSTSVQGATPAPSSSTGGGVSAGHALPVTGAPASAIISLGALMVAGGAASVWYTRRRRSA
ncbi:LPXTG cell wall anchor domain-containing protein [Paractinoplanes globisporus]|uniref:LPXTG cell wall anchor domain-containing protein n=1 Tax=Paractinoplanes globisporus TaxID=113565 RepID=A0ABW6WIP5_9ACTN|nr:LPXTG cell wall anchor domain-containing protein [Actinoplanes globisporus]